jgi:undecaprenyl diphosphate synthase
LQKDKNQITTIPRHIAIIMDGNGRWAQQRGKPRLAGHRAGAHAVHKTIKAAIAAKIEILSLFAFSTENWRRPQKEVSSLMQLLLKGLQEETKKLHENQIQLKFIGDRQRFSAKLREQMQQAELLTQHNAGLKLIVAVNYGGQWDITQAAQQLAQQVIAGKIAPKEINTELFAQFLTTENLPNPDLFIRTSGEQRISNFFLWQLAYAELYFTNVLWPDFDEKELQRALKDFAKRKRRFGSV